MSKFAQILPRMPRIAQNAQICPKCPKLLKMPKKCPELSKMQRIAQICPELPNMPQICPKCPELPKMPKFAQNCPKCPELPKMPKFARKCPKSPDLPRIGILIYLPKILKESFFGTPCGWDLFSAEISQLIESLLQALLSLDLSSSQSIIPNLINIYQLSNLVENCGKWPDVNSTDTDCRINSYASIKLWSISTLANSLFRYTKEI